MERPIMRTSSPGLNQYCTTCHEESPADAQFCIMCGSGLAATTGPTIVLSRDILPLIPTGSACQSGACEHGSQMSRYWLWMVLVVTVLGVGMSSVIALMRGSSAPSRPSRIFGTLVSQSLTDPNEGVGPDFRSLHIEYDDQLITVTLVFYRDLAPLGPRDFIYLYGRQNDMIRLSHTGFRLERDEDGDGGHFETAVYAGDLDMIASDTMRLHIPRSYMPDIADKEVWGYSMNSRDQIPDGNGVYRPQRAEAVTLYPRASPSNLALQRMPSVNGLSPDMSSTLSTR
jgi:hypothetical protein